MFPMYFAGYPVGKNKEIVEESGLHITNVRLETVEEEGGKGRISLDGSPKTQQPTYSHLSAVNSSLLHF